MSTFQLDLGDCVEWLRSIESRTVDLAITDPAYQSLEKHRAIGTTTRLTADWFPIFPNSRIADLLAELYRVLKDDTHAYIFCDQETMHFLWALMFELNDSGDDVQRTEESATLFPFTWWKHLTWEKTKLDSDEPAMGMGWHYRAAQECIVFLEKGKRKLNSNSVCDVLKAPRVPRKDSYPTEKPVTVIKTLIEQSSLPTDLVIDCFLGSGSTADMATQLGRRFAGCDITERSIQIARARLQPYKEAVVLTPRKPAVQASLF